MTKTIIRVPIQIPQIQIVRNDEVGEAIGRAFNNVLSYSGNVP